MHQMAINIDKASAVICLIDQMCLPDFVKQGAWLCHFAIPPSFFIQAGLSSRPTFYPRQTKRAASILCCPLNLRVSSLWIQDAAFAR
jgi:hypothetical protein